MPRWDDNAIDVIATVVSQAIKREDIQAALRRATSDDKVKHTAVTATLQKNAKIEEILAAVPAEVSAYKNGQQELRTYLLANDDDYRAAYDLENQIIQLCRRKMLELDQLETQRIRAETQERARKLQASREEQTQGAGRSRGSLFRRRNITQSTAESEQLAYACQRKREELTILRREVADIATTRKRLEDRNPKQRELSEKVKHVRDALVAAILEPIIIPNFRSFIAQYATQAGNEGDAQPTATSSHHLDGTLKTLKHSDITEEEDVVSQLEEVAPGKSVGVHGPGDKRSVFLVHGRDIRAAAAMRD